MNNKKSKGLKKLEDGKKEKLEETKFHLTTIQII